MVVELLRAGREVLVAEEEVVGVVVWSVAVVAVVVASVVFASVVVASVDFASVVVASVVLVFVVSAFFAKPAGSGALLSPCARAAVENTDRATNVEKRSERFRELRDDRMVAMLSHCCLRRSVWFFPSRRRQRHDFV